MAVAIKTTQRSELLSFSSKKTAPIIAVNKLTISQMRKNNEERDPPG